MSGTPVAYIRKSVVHNDTKSVSWEVQEAKVRELAAVHGDNGGRLLLLSDWNISGRKGASARPGYAELLRMIESGEASAVYSYSLSRLSRSVKDLTALMDLAKAHRVPVRLVADHVDTSTATGEMLFTILAAVDQMTADLASEHGRDAMAARRARGAVVGRAPYGTQPGEDVSVIADAFRRGGSFHAAARLLNVENVPTRLGRPWRGTTVRVLLKRYAPEVVPLGAKQGAKSAPPFTLARLLVCRCGRVLTGVHSKGRPRYVCATAGDDPTHGNPKTVSESEVLPAVRAEAELLRLPVDAVRIAAEHAEERARLAARLERAADLRLDGKITRARFDAEEAKVRAAQAKLGEEEIVLGVRPITADEWDTWDVTDLNAYLRAIFAAIHLGPDMRPLPFPEGPIWRDPSLRG